MKMVPKESNKFILFILLCLIAFQFTGASQAKSNTYDLLMQVNKNWALLAQDFEHTFQPQTEQELVQLHLFNVVSYLSRQPVTKLSTQQQKNRLLNLAILRKYGQAGTFPINTLTSFRTPIFIDANNTHCAVGYLLKESGYGKVAKEIAREQLLSYLKDIKHPQLITWQQASGLSMFELALIQPTYGPPLPICATPSPVEWNKTTANDSKITQLFKGPKGNSMYAISFLDELELRQEIRKFLPETQQWKRSGTQIDGQILDLAFCNNQMYISVVLTDEAYPHQLLKLKGNTWEKVVHFNGSIISMQVFQNKLYVLGNFKKVNQTISSNFVVIDEKSITPFRPVGLKNPFFDHMQSSKTALFLTSNGLIYKLKNDSLHFLTNIKYYSYFDGVTLAAVEDTLYVTSLSIQGYNAYFDHREHTSYLNNMMYGQDYPYSSVHFTMSQVIKGKMMLSGDFKTSTLIPQINDNTVLIHCADSASSHWFGEGLVYEHDQKYYPILNNGIVLDFIQLGDKIYVLRKDGSIIYTPLSGIEEKITQLRTGLIIKK